MLWVTVFYIAHCIVSITSLYLVHAFSNLSKLPFLVAVCCISLQKYFTLFCSATTDRGGQGVWLRIYST